MHPTIRASDAEREAVGQRLRAAHADGRIDSDELQERIGRCYSARTTGELSALVADLPSEPAPARAPAAGWRSMPRLALILPILLTLVFVGAVSHGHVFWIIPFLFFARFWVMRRGRWRGAWGGL